MRRRLVVGAFAICAFGSIGAGALDSVSPMRGSDTLKDLTLAVINACPDLWTYPTTDPIRYVGGGSTDGEAAMKSWLGQWVAPMTRPLGPGACEGGAGTSTKGIVFALDALDVVFGPDTSIAEGLDYAGTAGTATNWRTVLREVYTGMGPIGSNISERDCNSASRHAIVDNWDNLFRGSTGSTCSDSNPDAGAGNVEPGLRHAFRRDDSAGATDFFLGVLQLPMIKLQQVILGEHADVPAGSNPLQSAVYHGLLNSPFCNVRRPEDKTVPVNKGGSFIPPMYQVGLPVGAGGPTLVGSQGLVPFDPEIGESPRNLSPYVPDMQDQDPIRRKCFGPKVQLSDSPNAPREEVCAADGTLGVVLPITIPSELPQAERFPTTPCTEGDFEFGPAVVRPTGDPIRCPNGDAPQDGMCLLPNKFNGLFHEFNCLNNGLNSPAAIFDADSDGSDYPDAPTTDGRADADGRAYNLVVRAIDGTVRNIQRPNPRAAGTAAVQMVGAFYRLHSTRSGLAAPQNTRTCTAAKTSDDQIGCLVQLNRCSMGYAGGRAVLNNPGTIATPVNGVAPGTATVQALITGGLTYPLAHKVYLNSIRGFEGLLTSSDPGGVPSKDAELDFAQCLVNLPFSTFASVGGAQLNVASFGFVPLPPPSGGGNARAFCEDFVDSLCPYASTNVDACRNSPPLIPKTACDNGYQDGDEVGVDVCRWPQTSCNTTTHLCQ